MSLYRAWRPKSFSELVGQDAVVRTLSSALSGGKLAHAYLFSGPRGSGKTSAAKILARCIDCVAGPTPTPDNTCENCRAIIDGNALDVLEIDAASNRGIDEIRALRDAVKFAPASMRMKIYIIDEAHMLTKEGANAFLRTLEEPPPHVVFILATTEPERLPVTILSRCQRYAFARIAIPVMIQRMRHIADAEGIRIDDAALAAIAYRADGGLRDALTMLEQAAAFAASDGESIDTRTIDLAFGAAGLQRARSLLEAVLAQDAAAVMRAIEEASDAGADMQVLNRSLIAEFRNLLVARVDPALLARDLAPEDAERAARRAPEIPQATIVRALRVLSDALALARSGGNPRLELETALLRFVLAQEDPTLNALAARVAALEEREARIEPAVERAAPIIPSGAGKSGAVEAPAKTAPDASPAMSLQRVRAAWQSIRGKVEGQRQSLRAPLSRAVVEAVDGGAVTLALPQEVFADVLRGHVALIERAIEDVLGVPLHVKLRVDGSIRAKTATPDLEDPDELFNYASERIREKS
ncbi:MAG TPA: DNA polymerase III subunit gamma/tau [Candidatus Tyrphobacter sp.]